MKKKPDQTISNCRLKRSVKLFLRLAASRAVRLALPGPPSNLSEAAPPRQRRSLEIHHCDPGKAEPFRTVERPSRRHKKRGGTNPASSSARWHLAITRQHKLTTCVTDCSSSDCDEHRQAAASIHRRLFPTDDHDRPGYLQANCLRECPAA